MKDNVEWSFLSWERAQWQSQVSKQHLELKLITQTISLLHLHQNGASQKYRPTNFYQPNDHTIRSFIVFHSTCVWFKSIFFLWCHLQPAGFLWGGNNTRSLFCPLITRSGICKSNTGQICGNSCPGWNILTWCCSVYYWSNYSSQKTKLLLNTFTCPEKKEENACTRMA